MREPLTDARLAAIARNVEVGWTLPGRSVYALETITDLVAEVRYLRTQVAWFERRLEARPLDDVPSPTLHELMSKEARND